ncbi:MAG: RNA polymerase subunit sigma [Gemmatimonadetes bacterium]|nr:RNA polymerase subunit sigma [Gemmatimonadota bacterium]
MSAVAITNELDHYLDSIGALPLLGADEERELCRSARKGDNEARNRLVSSHLRFVVQVAKRYQYQGLSLHDLIQEGNLGLIRATERFDPERGFRFLSYASWWVRQSIVQALMDHGRTVRLPAYKVKRIRKARKAEARLSSKLGRPAEEDEVATELGLPTKALSEDRRQSQGPLSLDADIFVEPGTSFLDVLADDPDSRPDRIYRKRHRSNRLHEALATLPERHRRVLELYFGLNGEDPHTLDAVGKMHGFTRENARQIKSRALRSLAAALADLERSPLSSSAPEPVATTIARKAEVA